MILPPGVFRRSSSACLIAKDQQAVIRIDTATFTENDSYGIEYFYFDECIAPYLNGDWKEFDEQHVLDRIPKRLIFEGGSPQESPVIYSRTVNRAAQLVPTITVLPNFRTKKFQGLAVSCTALGSTMGHYYGRCSHGHKTQAVYEFHSYGMLAVWSKSDGLNLWVAQPGDKVAIPGECHVALYNLGDDRSPLVTLDFSCSEHTAVKESAIEYDRPVLLAYYNDFEVRFSFDRTSIESLKPPMHAVVSASVYSDQQLQVSIKRGGRLGLGRMLYEHLTTDVTIIGQFARLGVSIKKASPEVGFEWLWGRSDVPLHVSSPLVQAIQRGVGVADYFCRDRILERPIATQSSAKVISEIAEAKKRVISRARFSRREDEDKYKIVVEGAGDWVKEAYLPLLKRKMADLLRDAEQLKEENGVKELRVFYVNDSRWKEPPIWKDEIDKSWECYLDKADPEDLGVYEILNPDVVFIATPDLTHSEIAKWWLFKTPLVFVEKPFDSHISHVHDLLRERGRGILTADPRGLFETNIFGLDHWLFYAQPIFELRFEIEKHLDGPLSEIIFFMTEERAIEYKRDQSLQYGLTLDLLPHFLALLTFFGDVRTVDEVQVSEASQYEPLYAVDRDLTIQEDISEKFHAETHARLSFTFQDYSGSGRKIPCRAEVGKGVLSEKKYLEVRGRNGNAIRVDFKDMKGETDSRNPGYPYNHLFFLAKEQPDNDEDSSVQCFPVSDPYHEGQVLYVFNDTAQPERYRRELDRDRYRKLLDELVAGRDAAVTRNNTAAATTLSLREGEEIVRAVDFILRVVRERKGFVRYALPKSAYIASQTM